MIKQRKIELLAPAKNMECGIEAINHGADAVYIGAPKFGARAAAGNSLEDIAALVAHAHLYNARIYVTVNTRRTGRDGENDLGFVSCGSRCPHCARHGNHSLKPAAYSLARQYANG